MVNRILYKLRVPFTTEISESTSEHINLSPVDADQFNIFDDHFIISMVIEFLAEEFRD